MHVAGPGQHTPQILKIALEKRLTLNLKTEAVNFITSSTEHRILCNDRTVVFEVYTFKFPFDFLNPETAVFTDANDGHVIS